MLPLSFSLMTPRPPSPTLFPYTTLFRSRLLASLTSLMAVAASAQADGWSDDFNDGSVTDGNPVTWGQNPHRSEEHTSELQSRLHLVCRLVLEKKKIVKLRSGALSFKDRH